MTRLAFIGLFLVALGAIVYVLFSAVGGKPPSNPLERYAKGDMAKLSFASSGEAAPTDNMFAADGTPVTLDAWKGKTVLVNYWATWCSPCEREMPSLGALQTARGGDAFEIVAVSVDSSEDKDYAAKRLGELGAANISFHIAPPENYEIVYASGVKGFPTSIIYGPDGKEIARLAGDADWSAIEAVSFIDAILAKAG
ncbi:MAG: TlpA family protein disulfide reductase [Alphaproteobacteria bacterium]|nr:TlpA family protein disulfide reductase [Alphaproteobacteria bacterium]MBU2083716.1 TlpA family protein disulfide reductase [Alphaproteobacteria bacterium]MBU2143862.1 TlpA family protein disulfide reductase [Alphaproteobacteria bacterium]MBU2197977.1 TlpA family protein disulfide reductase [Alphaproteobacteria bacterium]